jgi:hypothetical protein
LNAIGIPAEVKLEAGYFIGGIRSAEHVLIDDVLADRFAIERA